MDEQEKMKKKQRINLRMLFPSTSAVNQQHHCVHQEVVIKILIQPQQHQHVDLFQRQINYLPQCYLINEFVYYFLYVLSRCCTHLCKLYAIVVSFFLHFLKTILFLFIRFIPYDYHICSLLHALEAIGDPPLHEDRLQAEIIDKYNPINISNFSFGPVRQFILISISKINALQLQVDFIAYLSVFIGMQNVFDLNLLEPPVVLVSQMIRGHLTLEVAVDY